MLFGIETWRRQTHQEPVTAIDEESGHDVPDEPLAPEAPVTTSPLYSPYIFLLVGISMSVIIAVRDHTLGLRRNAQTMARRYSRSPMWRCIWDVKSCGSSCCDR